MNKLKIFFIGVAILSCVACNITFPDRVFDLMQNNIVMEKVDDIFVTDGYALYSYTFEPTFTDTELASIYYIDAKIINSLDEEVDSIAYKKSLPGPEAKGSADEASGETGVAPEIAEPLVDTGWEETSFAWTPKKEDGSDYLFPADSYRYIVTVYNIYEEAEGKVSFDGAQKRTFVCSFDIVPATKLDSVSVVRLKTDQDTGFSNVDGITQTDTDLVFRGILNTNPELLTAIGLDSSLFDDPNTKISFEITPVDGVTVSSGEIDVSGTGNASLEDFEDIVDDSHEDKEFYRYFSWTSSGSIKEGKVTAKMVLSYTTGGLSGKNESGLYNFEIDKTAPVVVWDYVMLNESMVQNSGKTVAGDTLVTSMPTFEWGSLAFDAPLDPKAEFQRWMRFSFADGTKVASLNPMTAIYTGVNFTPLLEDLNGEDFVFDSKCVGIQEISIECYDIAGNRALAKSGDSELTIKRRLRVLDLPSFEVINGDFEVATPAATGWVWDLSIFGVKFDWSGWMSPASLSGEDTAINEDTEYGLNAGIVVDCTNNTVNGNFGTNIPKPLDFPAGNRVAFIPRGTQTQSGANRWISRVRGTLTQTGITVKKGVPYHLKGSSYYKNELNTSWQLYLRVIGEEELGFEETQLQSLQHQKVNYDWETQSVAFTPKADGMVSVQWEKSDINGGDRDAGGCFMDDTRIEVIGYSKVDSSVVLDPTP